MKTTSAVDLIRSRCVVVLVLLWCSMAIVGSLANSVPNLLKMEGSANLDLFVIPGKNCNTPTIIRQGKKGVFSHRGKLIVIEPECKLSHYDEPMEDFVMHRSYAPVELSMQQNWIDPVKRVLSHSQLAPLVSSDNTA